MQNLFFRNRFVFGVLMVCVLMLSVQGVADALRFTSEITRKDLRDLHVYTGDPFEVEFSVRLENSQAKDPSTKKGSSTDISYASDASTRTPVSVKIIEDTGWGQGDTHYTVSSSSPDTTSIPGVSIITDTRAWDTSGTTRGSSTDISVASGSSTRTPPTATITVDDGYIAGETHYTVNTTTTLNTGVRLTKHIRTWLTEAEAYYYNGEAVTITPTGGITIISINGYNTGSAANTAVTLNEDQTWGGTTTSELKSGSIRVKCQVGSTAGAGTITVSDGTSTTDDYPAGVSAATPPSPFQINIVTNPLSLTSTTFPTIASVSEGVITHNVRTQITVTLTGSNNTNAEVGFEVLPGYSGTLYRNREGGSSAKKLLTYTDSSEGVASVYLLPNSRTNRVRVWVSGQNPTSSNTNYARVVTYTYGFADLTADVTLGGPGGNGQRGVDGTRLPNPFIVKVIDGSRRGFAGAAVKFSATPDGAVLFPYPDFRAEPGDNDASTTEDTHGDAVAGYDPLVITTDRNGEAKVHLQLKSRSGETGGIRHTVTASYQGASQTFTATGIAATSATYVLTVDTQRSTQTQNVALRTRASKPLVVRVLEGGVNPVAGQAVRFTTTDGTLSPRREAVQVTDTASSPPVPNLPHDRTISTDVRGEAWIDYIAGNSAGPVTIYARAFNHSVGSQFSRIDSANTVTFRVNVGSSAPPPSRDDADDEEDDDETDDDDDDTTPTGNTISVSTSSLSGGTGEVVELRVLAGTAATRVTVTGDSTFILQGGLVSGTGTTRSVILPTTEGFYSLTVSAANYDTETVLVTVSGAAPAPGAGSAVTGTLSIRLTGARSGDQQAIQVTAQPSPSSDLTVTLSGATNPPTLTISAGESSTTRVATLPTTTGAHTLRISATGYNPGSVTVPAVSGQQPPTTGPVGEADSLEIDGQRLRSGLVNERLDAPLRVRVVDANGRGVSGVQVTFRVLSPAQGTFAGARGKGNAIRDETDRNGYASATFTPTSAGDVVVRAEASGVSPVTFILDVNGAPGRETDTRTPDPGVTPSRDTSREIDPVVHVGAAHRPSMLWVDGGSIYALIEKDVQRFAPSMNNVMHLAIGAGKLYWTEKTGESSGSINSANLDGTGVKELTSIMSVPIGIAVDEANSKLYWTNSRGRIQSANLDGSSIRNVMENRPNPMDIAIAQGNLYWTEYDATTGTGNVGLTNSTGRGSPKYISTGTNMPGSLAIANKKVYWTEKTGTSSGTVNAAKLNGTEATEIASILAAPMGIAVDTTRNKLYWTNSRGRIQSANLDGSAIQNVVGGLGNPGEIILGNSIQIKTTDTVAKTSGAKGKYDVNGDGKVDNTDASLVAAAMNTSNAKYDVNGDGAVNFLDLLLVFDNRDAGAAGAPTIVGMKLTAVQVDILQEQIELLIATGDRSPAAMRTLIYLQQLIATARPEKTQLLANYPNPFNPETWIPYELATDTEVRITIYSPTGVVVRALQLGHQTAGYYTDRERAAYWDGRNAAGEQVASGLYFYQLETDRQSLLRKMVILK